MSEANLEILRDYRINRLLADGCHGSVRLGTSFRGSPVVVKKMAKKEVDPVWVQNEVKAGSILKQKGLVSFREHISDEENDYVVLDYIKGKDLLEFMESRSFKPLSEKVVRKIAKRLMKSLRHCHEKGIIHKDLKLENVMIDQKMKPILIDFGFCEFAEPTEKSVKWVGTPDYAAPEIILKKPYSGYKADIYSSGVVIFSLLTGVLPFDLKKKCEILWAGKKPQVNWDEECLPKLSSACKELINGMLEADPDIRLDVNGVLNSKWMKKFF
eukprot:TRINITY_DN9724_c0_g1_i1.p1 TRINITY_DN9724_c0_g1~~TRINITY_DN9724_c0_g1_i1.p1  ORF type:complete len:270 (-),score=81.24 TRINITY_DN9724_c0_g1_i1:46-855(-)